MKKLLLSSLVIFALAVQPALAVQIDYLGIIADVKEDGTVDHVVNINFVGPTDYLEYNIFSDITNVSVLADGKQMNCRIENGPISKISCDLTKLQSGKMEIRYKANSLIKISNGKMVFSSDYRTPVVANTLYIKVNLPEGCVLVQQNSNLAPCLPSNCLYASDGRRMIVIWSTHDVGPGNGLYVSTTYESIKGATNSELPLLFLAVPLVVIAGLLAFTFYIYRQKIGVKMFIPVLKKDEKMIVEKLMSSKGFTNQKTLVEESGYSKAKVSKLLKSLEERGIVKTERLGRKNKVFLSRNIENKEQKGSGNNQKR
ncbi:MAG: hypothetical protein QXU82_03185 [Candidatus Aenigmatarchaeota archaeon]